MLAAVLTVPLAAGFLAATATPAAATTSAPSDYTWTGASTTSTNWSDASNWTSSSTSGSAPSGSVGTLTFPDLADTTYSGGGTCDAPPSPPPSASPACYTSVDNVAGLSASGVSFTGPASTSAGQYFVSAANGATLTIGNGGVTNDVPSAPNVNVPITLGSSQTWALGDGGGLFVGDDVTGASADLNTTLTTDGTPGDGGTSTSAAAPTRWPRSPPPVATPPTPVSTPAPTVR